MTTPLVCVAVAFLLVYVPKIPLSLAQAKAPGGYDNANPRAQQAALTGWGERARNAHTNGFESFPGFAAAALVAHVVHADAKWSAILAVTYCVARTLYPFVYVANLGTLRSAVWTVGFAATLGLFALPLFAG